MSAFDSAGNRDLNANFLKRLIDVECRDATYRALNPSLVFSRAKGSRLWDVEGREYIDLCAGFGALPLGHNSQAFISAMSPYTQSGEYPPIEHGMGDVYPSVQKVELLETLLRLCKRQAPNLSRISLALTGSQAVEIAVKTAILKTSRVGFISFDFSYHGVDLGVLPVTWRSDFKAPFKDFLPKSPTLSLPYNCSKEDLEQAFTTFGPNKVAAVIVEPIQGRGGVQIPRDGWLYMLGEVAHRHGALLILDEVFVGLGRAGGLTSADSCDADLICLGKALGGGMPLSACVGKEEVMNAWPESAGEAIHTGTFFGHPLSCSVAHQTLLAIESEDLVTRSQVLGKEILAYLQERLRPSKEVKEIRGQGLMIAIEGHADLWGAKKMDVLRKGGIIALACGDNGRGLQLSPALNIERDLLFYALDKICSLIS